MPEPVDHAPDCVLDPVHWFRHAIGAAQRLLSDEPDADAPYLDKVSARALLDALEQHAEFDDSWRTVTLYDVAKSATLMREDFAGMCTCKRGPGPTTVRL